jgi:uncharacterized protein (TIGR02145 family)
MKRLILLTILFIAAFNLSAQDIIRVKIEGSGDGTTWTNAASLESALTLAKAAGSGTQIWVQTGTYHIRSTVRVPAGVELYGGFLGIESETNLSDRNYATNQTIFGAQRQFAAVYLEAGAVLNGFTVRNGMARTFEHHSGGGVFMENNARVENCYILNCAALNDGGGIYAVGDGLVYNTVLAGNQAGIDGDGAAIFGTSLRVVNTTIADNQKMTDFPGIQERVVNISICHGQSATLIIPVYTPYPPHYYLWDENAGNTISRTFTTPALAENTTYKAIVVDPTREYVAEMTFNIQVRPIPTLEITTNIDTADAGELLLFTAEVSPAGGTFRWHQGSTFEVFSTMMPSIGNVVASCTYTYEGCEVEAFKIVTNSVCSPPTSPTLLTTPRSTICFDDSTVLIQVGGDIRSGMWVLYRDTNDAPLSNSISSIITVSPDSTTTFFVRGEGCGTVTDWVYTSITVHALPPEIQGLDEVCQNDTTQLFSEFQVPGKEGYWSTSSNLLTISEDGLVTGLFPGIAQVIYYYDSNNCSQSHTIAVKALPLPIGISDFSYDARGAHTFELSRNEFAVNMCQGETRVYASIPLGGRWTVSDETIATIQPSGAFRALLPGRVEITYTSPVTGCIVRDSITIHDIVKITSLERTMCKFQDLQLYAIPADGVWRVTPDELASIDRLTGELYSVSDNHIIVSYSTVYCQDTIHIHVRDVPTYISLATRMCVGDSTIARIDLAVEGGEWISSNPAVATVTEIPGSESSVFITAMAVGTYNLIYRSLDGCEITTTLMEVHQVPNDITGETVVGVGQIISLNSSVGGFWSSNNAGVATVSSLGGGVGDVLGIAPGTVTIRYTYTMDVCSKTYTVEVVECPILLPISGAESFDQTVCNGEAITNVQITMNSATVTTAIEWFKDGTTRGNTAPAGLTFNDNTISGSPTEAGNFSYIISSVGVQPTSICPAYTLYGRILVRDVVNAGVITTDIFGTEDIQVGTACFDAMIVGIQNHVAGSGGNPGGAFYRWESSVHPYDIWTSIAGASGLSYQPPYALTADIRYRRIFENSCGADTTEFVEIEVNEEIRAPEVVVDWENDCGDGGGTITIVQVEGVEYLLNGLLQPSTVLPGENLIITGLQSGIHVLTARIIGTQCSKIEIDTIKAGPDIPMFWGFEIDGNTVLQDYAFCHTVAGDHLTIKADATIGPGRTLEYEWRAGRAPLSGTPDFYTWRAGTLLETEDSYETIIPFDTAIYTVIIRDDEDVAEACIVVRSITIAVTPDLTIPPALQPKSDTACVGTRVISLTFAPPPGIHSYQWFRVADTAGGALGEEIPGANGITYVVPNEVASEYFYRCRITPFDGVCDEFYTEWANVTFIAYSSIPAGTIVLDTICGDGTASLIAFSTVATDSIQWFTSLIGGDSLGSTLSGQPFTTPLTAASMVTNAVFYAQAFNGFCASVPRIPIAATIYPEQILQRITGSTKQELCLGHGVEAIQYSIAGSATSLNIVWDTIMGMIPGAPSGINVMAVPGSVMISGIPTIPGTYPFTVTTTGAAVCAPKSERDSIVVFQIPGRIEIDDVTNRCDSAVLIASGGDGGLIYFQDQINLGTSLTEQTDRHTIRTGGTYYFRAFDATTGCWGYQSSITTTINQSVEIIVQPRVRAENEMEVLHVIASGTEPFTYQWYYKLDDDNYTGATRIEDATTSLLTPFPLQIQYDYFYFCVVSNVCGTDTSVFAGIHHVLNECNKYPPDWGLSFGEVGFTAAVYIMNDENDPEAGGYWIDAITPISEEWAVGNLVWSSKVAAEACHSKSTFSGIRPGNPITFNADCRSNPDQSGDLFSWCAVLRFGDELCPYPWRVPTRQEWIEFNSSSGGPGEAHTSIPTRNNYEKFLGIEFLGYCDQDGNLIGQGALSYYWAQPTLTDPRAYAHHVVSSTGFIDPALSFGKFNGAPLRCVKELPATAGCNTSVPGFGLTLDSVSFVGRDVWVIGEQLWSDAVQAKNCSNKRTYNAGILTLYDYNADCRSNPNKPGDLFSFCAVQRFQNVLCPFPWRVPTVEDFIALDRSLGGTGENGQSSSTHLANLVTTFGAAFSGYAYNTTFTDTNTGSEDFSGAYWSSTPLGKVSGLALYFDIENTVNPAHSAPAWLGHSVRCVRDLPPSGCNTEDTPDFGTTLGMVEFASNTEWTVGELIWSDVIEAENCSDKTTFDGGYESFYKADCRSNPGQKGHLFSWCVLSQFGSELCPRPWRLPTAQDFINLDIALGGTGSEPMVSYVNATIRDRYISLSYWGGNYTRHVLYNDVIDNDTSGYYWSSTDIGGLSAGFLTFDQNPANITPQGVGLKSNGLAVRCVRDAPVGCEGGGLAVIGEVSRLSTQEWLIGTQYWSDVVLASECSKLTYNGGSPDLYRADCRQTGVTGEATGHWFSWCAVMKFADQLCPAPWRVPVREDLVELNIALGGRGVAEVNQVILNNYLTTWGATYNGYYSQDFGLRPNSGTHANYWAQSGQSATLGVSLSLVASTRMVNPLAFENKAFGYQLRCVRDATAILACDDEEPNFGATLGTISFASNNVWTQGSHAWSDAVQASNCSSRTSFDAGASAPYQADCRSNPNRRGDLFSMCVIRRFANDLCPTPWRIPTADEFQTLDLSLGGVGTQVTSPMHRDRYLNHTLWGGEYNGFAFQNQALETSTEAYYWSRTREGVYADYKLFFNSDGLVNPALGGHVTRGFAVRCIRDIDPTTTDCHLGEPKFGRVLEQTSFVTEQTWVIGNQEWSDVVTSPSCQKTTFDAGTVGNFFSDCRSNPTQKGDLFSWCAMMQYQNVICPAPWRVPNRQDLANLDQAIGGPGTGAIYTDALFRDTYIRVFAPTYSGYATSPSGTIQGIGTWGLYWATTTTTTTTTGFTFSIRSGTGANATLFDQTHALKNNGIGIRCVRDVIVGCGPGGLTFTPSQISWDNSRERTIAGVTWGSYVSVTVCNKAAFNANAGAVSTVFTTDCRLSGSGDGSLFSMCAIKEFGHMLCPAPCWRLPTPADKIALDRGLLGTGLNGQDNTTLASAYIRNCGNGTCWAGSFTGYALNGVLYDAHTVGHYWAMDNNDNIVQLTFSNRFVNPTAPVIPNAGYSVRCIKVTPAPAGCR